MSLALQDTNEADQTNEANEESAEWCGAVDALAPLALDLCLKLLRARHALPELLVGAHRLALRAARMSSPAGATASDDRFLERLLCPGVIALRAFNPVCACRHSAADVPFANRVPHTSSGACFLGARGDSMPLNAEAASDAVAMRVGVQLAAQVRPRTRAIALLVKLSLISIRTVASLHSRTCNWCARVSTLRTWSAMCAIARR